MIQTAGQDADLIFMRAVEADSTPTLRAESSLSKFRGLVKRRLPFGPRKRLGGETDKCHEGRARMLATPLTMAMAHKEGISRCSITKRPT